MTEIEIIAGAQQLERFAYSQTPLTVSEITKRLNELLNTLQCSALKNTKQKMLFTHLGAE